MKGVTPTVALRDGRAVSSAFFSVSGRHGDLSCFQGRQLSRSRRSYKERFQTVLDRLSSCGYLKLRDDQLPSIMIDAAAKALPELFFLLRLA